MGAPRVLIRCEAGPQIGGGHVMRCLALAEALSETGADVAFCTNRNAARTAPALARSGYAVVEEDDRDALAAPGGWAQGWDWTVIDRYGPRDRLVEAARRGSSRIAALHELDEPAPDADVLIDPSPNTRAVPAPPGARLLKGPRYALIRNAFRRARSASLTRPRDSLQAITVTLGLTDPGGRTIDVARAVAGAARGLELTLILGPDADPSGRIAAACAGLGFEVHVDPHDLEDILSRSDLVVGAGGGGALERCVLGVPSMLLVLADNQRVQAQALDEAGAAMLVTQIDQSPALIRKLADQPGALAAMSRRAASLCDGEGAPRVAKALTGPETTR